jgi:hypothetical protein
MKTLTALALAATMAFFQAGQSQGTGGNSNRPASATDAMYRAAADSAERKIEHIQQNASRPQPDQTPTQFSEREINAYLASGKVKFPAGVQRVQLTGEPGIINATTRVDFDQITASRRSANPLLAFFTGVHDVQVEAHAQGSGGQGQVHVDSVSIDGVAVPRMALQFFMDRYIAPKYPGVGLDSTFQMPERIDTATIGAHTLTVTQK